MAKKISKKELNHDGRRKSIREGIFWSIKSSFGDGYISPFAIAINSSNSLVAMLSSLSGILGPLSQIVGSRLIEKNSRKKILTRTIFIESLLWLPLILISFLFYKGIISSSLPLFLLIIFSCYIIVSNLGHPAWFSWMGDIVDEKYRGRFFSKRNLILGFISVIFSLMASYFLDYFESGGNLMFGFGILFFLAFILEILRVKTFQKQYEPKIELKKGYYFSFFDFLRKAPKNNFGRFTIYRGLLAFSQYIASPLIAVYLLRYLGFNYHTYMFIVIAGSLSSILILELWGKFADKYGNYRVMALTSVLIPILPLLWIIHSSPIYLILLPQVVRGNTWAGFNLAAGNFIYDNVSAEKRGLGVSYYYMVWGIGVFLGAGLGALLIDVLKTTWIEPLMLIFIISTITRMIVVFWWIPKIKEIKKTEKLKRNALKNIIFRDVKPTLIEEFHEITHLKKYFGGRN